MPVLYICITFTIPLWPVSNVVANKVVSHEVSYVLHGLKTQWKSIQFESLSSDHD